MNETTQPVVYADYWSENSAPMLLIDTEQWLTCIGDADDPVAVELQAEIDAMCEADEHMDSDEILDALCAKRGWFRSGGDNSYNHDNDLSSDIDFHIIGSDIGDPYADDQYMVFRVHRGGDARGNYADPRVIALHNPDDGWYGDWSIEVWVREVLPEAPQEDALFDAGARRYPMDETFDNLYQFTNWCNAQGIDEDELFPSMPVGVHEVPNVQVTDKDGIVWECWFTNRATMGS